MTPLGIPAHLAETLSAALAAGDPDALKCTLGAAVNAATSYKQSTNADAVAAVERFNGTVNDANTYRAKFRDLGVPALTVPQALAIVEALKLGNALSANAEFDPDFVPTQFLEVLTDMTGFSTVAANVAARLEGRAAPDLPIWTDGHAKTQADDARAAFNKALLATQSKLSETIRAASAALVKAEDANALVAALTAASSAKRIESDQ